MEGEFYGARYCNGLFLIDKFLKIIGIKDDPREKVFNAEILLVGYESFHWQRNCSKDL